MANILTNKPAEPPKIEQVALFHLFEFEGDEKTIVCLKPTRIGRGGKPVLCFVISCRVYCLFFFARYAG
jgi:hypothetical protein